MAHGTKHEQLCEDSVEGTPRSLD
eukprot:COSAG04_NODE_28613_length_274_cov_1.051429_1_plen_23_part_01